VQAAAAEVIKELALQERREIGLQEKRKHAVGRAKKLKKSVQEVLALPSSIFCSCLNLHIGKRCTEERSQCH
jgi:hypothetical protein